MHMAIYHGSEYFSHGNYNNDCSIPEDDPEYQCVDDVNAYKSAWDVWRVECPTTTTPSATTSPCVDTTVELCDECKCTGDVDVHLDKTVAECMELALAAGVDYFSWRETDNKCRIPITDP